MKTSKTLFKYTNLNRLQVVSTLSSKWINLVIQVMLETTKNTEYTYNYGD